MKCDRRWWNDGRLEREKAACVDDEQLGVTWSNVGEGDRYAVHIYARRRDDALRLRAPISQREVEELWREIGATRTCPSSTALRGLP